jgi:tetratricopeptide (TPR) repeat protein
LSTRKAALRDVASRVANDLGVYLQQAGLFAEADAAYTQARRFTPANLSATLNQFGLRLCHKEIGSSQELEALLLQRSRGPHFSETMDEEICQGGLLVAQEADAILPEALTSIPVGTPVPPQLMALLSRWFPRSYLKSASETPILAPPSADASDLNKAFAARAAGRTNLSETLLRRFVTEHPENLSAWALLAEQLLEKGSSDEVESRIIPAMRAANGNDQNALVEMTQGALCLHTKPPRQAMARAAFRRALQLSPELAIAGDQLLGTSLALGDAGFVEEDASTVIGCMPSNTLAHALLGSLRLKQQRYQEAEFHLRSSLASRASAGAHNDLAELYRRQKKWAEAEPHARAALRMDPGFYQAWDTLGYTLADSGRMSDAEAVFRCVTKLCPFAAEGYLGLAEVWRKQGRVKETAQLLQHVTAKLANMPPATRAKLERLRAELSLHIDLPEATPSGRPQISS